MKIIIGKTSGFCYGVKRAVEGSLEQVKEKKEIYCLGELVHNEQVISDLESKGMKFINDINEVNNTEVIIRAHGVKKEVYEIAKKRNIKLIDYTCPNVLKIHDIAREYRDKGYFIVLVGKKTHPENIGTSSHCGENYFVIENENDVDEAIKKIEQSNLKDLLVIVQTTFSEKNFESIEKQIKEKINPTINLVVKNTICASTSQRQKETEEISKQVEFMIIIGGKNSSNTQKLYEIAKNNCENAILIQNPNEINLEEIKKYNKIGVMAGASTPNKNIEEVKKLLV